MTLCCLPSRRLMRRASFYFGSISIHFPPRTNRLLQPVPYSDRSAMCERLYPSNAHNQLPPVSAEHELNVALANMAAFWSRMLPKLRVAGVYLVRCCTRHLVVRGGGLCVDLPLAGQVVVALVPYLSRLLSAAGQGILGGLTDESESRSWPLAKSLWNWLQPRIAAKPAALEAMRDVAERPNDHDAQAALRLQLRKLFAEDPIWRQKSIVSFERLKDRRAP